MGRALDVSAAEPQDVDPVTLTWWMSRRLVADELPEHRTVVEFDYTGADATRIWMVIERRDTSVCTDPPGFENDVVVTTDPVALMRVFSGIVTYGHALADGSLTLSGPSHLTTGAAALVCVEPVRTGGAPSPRADPEPRRSVARLRAGDPALSRDQTVPSNSPGVTSR